MEFFAYHDSQDTFFRSPFGAVPCGQEITFHLELCSTTPIDNCILRLWVENQEVLLPLTKLGRNPEPQTTSQRNNAEGVRGCTKNQSFCLAPKSLYEVHYKVPEQPGLVWYYFILPFHSKTYYYGNNTLKLGGLGELWEQEPPAFQITVYSPTKVPDWYKTGVMYQIYVDRFFNGNENGLVLHPKEKSLLHSNWSDTPFYIKDSHGRVLRWNFFGGNLKGVLQKLPYLKALGVSILYLNPIFDSPSNHKYDTGDYHHIDPMYGNEQDLEKLVREAKKQGIAILLDGVFSHTGSDSVYFNRYGNYPGLGAYQSTESPYFKWFKFNHYPEDYTCWWGVEDLPEVNEREPSYRDFIYGGEGSVMKKWMDKGIKGWRLDVADELPDEFIQGLRETMKKLDPESVLIGEVWEDATNKMSYGKLREYFWGRELDATMNYPLREILLRFILGETDAERVHQSVMNLYENYPPENFYGAMNLLGSHDRTRILTLLGQAPSEEELTEKERETYRLPEDARKLGIQRLKLLSLLQLTFPGVPCLYYGDEVGLEGYSDPYNRGAYPWGKEDLELLNWYQRMTRLRQEYEVLLTGGFVSFWAGTDVYGFKRTGESEEILVLINRNSSLNKEITLDFYPFGSDLFILDLISGDPLAQGEIKDLTLEMPPLQGRVILVEKNILANSCTKPNRCKELTRSCGILMPISSLPSPWGIGDVGEEAYHFIDFLRSAGHNIWQILPLNPPDARYSPYQSESAFAGNPLLISIDRLIQEGLISREEAAEALHRFIPISIPTVSHGSVHDSGTHPFVFAQELKDYLLRLAFQRFQVKFDLHQSSTYLSNLHYQKFLDENQDWLEDYVLFRALKVAHQELPWYEWEQEIAERECGAVTDYSQRLLQEMEFTRFVQYTFFTQWRELKQYAQEKELQLIGDLPIFVAGDSCDTWANRDLFALNDKGVPAKLAGVPPDYFSPTGQLWGNPVYVWPVHTQTDYSWWKNRIQHALNQFDWLRLDHFRGFEAYWEIPAGKNTAIHGNWMKGPGLRFFHNLKETFGELPFIAEDLGVITPEVKILKTLCGFPGMKVLQFDASMEEESDHFIYYSGTHDNDTLLGWVKNQLQATELCELETAEISRRCRKYLEQLYSSKASWVILPMQDLLGLDSDARMNIPGTIEGNWKWRMEKDALTDELQKWLKTQAQESNRSSDRASLRNTERVSIEID